MKTPAEIRDMATAAKRSAGWQSDGTYAPLGPEGDNAETRSYAEGAEAALLWVLGDAPDPLNHGPER